MKASIAERIQAALLQENLDGWMLYSFRGSDPIAENVLHPDHTRLATRRWFYFVPADGEPIRLVHAIESEMLDALPGEKKVDLPWQQLHSHLADILAGSHRIAMQYSPLNAIPYNSRVDAGTVELVRSFGVDVVSSADLVQTFEAVWTAEQVETHLYAAGHMRKTVDMTSGEVTRRIREKTPTTELDIQEFIWNQYEERDMTSSHRPIVAINSHSADPHYQPDREHNRSMNKGDFLLIDDIFAKKRVARDLYDDITSTWYIGRSAPDKYEAIPQIVKCGRDAAIGFVQQSYPGKTLAGWQVDNTERQSITQAGHSIHEEDHGKGANIDSLETQDNRRLMRGTCFSIEPGVYLKGQFGVRCEVNVYLGESEAVVTGQPIQPHGAPILSL